jgi:small subunit ribosomal protein S17
MTGATPQVQQTKRKTKVGRVVSDKMDKTIVVSVERLARHPLYKRVIRLTTKFKAHDEDNDAHTGDTVLIEESRPLSATKRWRLIEVVARAGEHGSPSDIVAEEEATTEAIHAAAHPGRTREEPAESPETGRTAATNGPGAAEAADEAVGAAAEPADEGGPA